MRLWTEEELGGLLTTLNEYIWIHRERLDNIASLRFVWLSSYKKSGFKPEILELFLTKLKKTNDFRFNYKNCTNILQVLMNLYPEAAKGFFLGESFEALHQRISDSGNKYIKYFEEFAGISNKAKLIVTLNSSNKQVVYLESYKSIALPFIASKLRIHNKSIQFEEKVCGVLDHLKLKYQRNVRFGIYEIDVLLENDKTVLEINGDTHYIFSMKVGKYCKTDKTLIFKMRHLKLWGINKFAVISFAEWREIDFNLEKAAQYILKKIKESEEIKEE